MEEDLETIEDAFETIPEDVKRYIYSSEFDKKLTALYAETGTPEDVQKKFYGVLLGYIASVVSETELLESIQTMIPDKQMQEKVQNWIKENVVQRISTIIIDAITNENNEDEEGSDAAKNIPIPISSPLGSKLLQPTNTASTKRDYSLDKTPSIESSSDEPKKFDPYHEPIEK